MFVCLFVFLHFIHGLISYDLSSLDNGHLELYVLKVFWIILIFSYFIGSDKFVISSKIFLSKAKKCIHLNLVWQFVIKEIEKINYHKYDWRVSPSDVCKTQKEIHYHVS